MSGKYSGTKVEEAIMHAQYVLESCSIPFVVLGDIARQMKYGEPFEADRVVFGVKKQHAVVECTSLLQILDPKLEILTDGWRIITNGVPVYVKILEKNYPTLRDPDIVFSLYETFNIPNPFEEYWKGDHLDI